MAKCGGTPPFSPKNKCVQNDLEWLEMHFKHNFEKVKIWSDFSPPPKVKKI